MASTADWFESVAEAQRRARRRVPRSVYQALLAGAERGVTMDDNVRAFAELGLMPRVATGVPADRGLQTTVLGRAISMPVLISPVGAQGLHPDGEVGIARAAAAAGVAAGLSSFASHPVEAVVEANPATFFQMYWLGTRERMSALLDRVRAAGAAGVIVTLDWTFAHRRDWGSPALPERLDRHAIASLAPQAAVRPRWLLRYARSRHLPELTVPNMGVPGGEPVTFFGAYGEWMGTAAPSWDDIAWLREQWGGPFMVKGICHPDDARRAVALGADAISVSNHGGNNLDGTPASIRLLPAVAAAVGGDVEVLMDGGVRRGSDVVKALALGARAVLVGRAHLWGLAANGETGVRNVLDILRSGIDETLAGLGRASISDLVPDDVVVPAGFTAGRPPHATPPSAAGAPDDTWLAARSG